MTNDLALSSAVCERVRLRWTNQSSRSSITIHHSRWIELPRCSTNTDVDEVAVAPLVLVADEDGEEVVGVG